MPEKEGSQAILDAIQFRNLKLLIIIEGRRRHCWSCRQPGQLDKDCLGKADGNKASEQLTPPENTSKFAKGWAEKLLHRLNLQVIARKTEKKLKKNPMKKTGNKKPEETDKQMEVMSPTKNKRSSFRKQKNKKKTLPEPESKMDEPITSPLIPQIFPEEMDHDPLSIQQKATSQHWPGHQEIIKKGQES